VGNGWLQDRIPTIIEADSHSNGQDLEWSVRWKMCTENVAHQGCDESIIIPTSTPLHDNPNTKPCDHRDTSESAHDDTYICKLLPMRIGRYSRGGPWFDHREHHNANGIKFSRVVRGESARLSQTALGQVRAFVTFARDVRLMA